jgi:hypothetical protein
MSNAQLPGLAAASVAVHLGLLTSEQAVARMKVSGTAPSYPGLYKCATDARPATAAELDAVSDVFPERWKTSGLVQSMVVIDEANDQLRLVENAGWRTPPDHPDLVPAAIAGRLADHLRDLHDDEAVKAHADDFKAMLTRGATAAALIEDGLVSGRPAIELSAQFRTVGASCTDCHMKYRN